MRLLKPTPEVTVFGTRQDTYYVLGVGAIFLCGLLLVPLCIWTPYRPDQAFGVFFLVLAASYAFNVIRAFLRVREAYSYYHYYLLGGCVTALYARFSGESVLLLLDLFVLCASFIGIFGRLGCYHAGCCHGKSFGGRNAPTQLMESGLHFVNVAMGIALLVTGAREGIVFLSLVSVYSCGRFFIEFLRADRRKHFLAVSEAQWTSLCITVLLLCLAPFFAAAFLPALAAILIAELVVVIGVAAVYGTQAWKNNRINTL